MAAIQDWKRQQVQHRQIDVKNHTKPQYQLPPVLALEQVAVKPDNHHRPAELLHSHAGLWGKYGSQRAEDLADAVLDLLNRTRVRHGFVCRALVSEYSKRRITAWRFDGLFRGQGPIKLLVCP